MKASIGCLLMLLALVSYGGLTEANRLPGMADLLDRLQKEFEEAMNLRPELKPTQRQELIKKFKAKIREFPNVSGWHTLKPSQIPQYLKELNEYADKVTSNLLAEVKRSLVDIGERLPGLRDLVEFLQKRFEAALDHITGLTPQQREVLIQDFLAGIRNFANDNNIQTLKPSELKKYLENITTYADNVIKSVLEKAKAFAQENSKTAF